MTNWSEFQPEEYLEATRQSFLVKDYAPVIANRCGIKNGSYILEVGCGTGAFSQYIAQSVENVKFVGIDNDKRLLEYYNRVRRSESNTFLGILGDAFHLPFEDETFDVVCSHTFLTCIQHPKEALQEMKRVCKKGGVISSITAMSWEHTTTYDGNYPIEVQSFITQFRELYAKVYRAYYEQFNGMSMAQGVSLNKVPLLFRDSGLKKVSILSVGRAFSLSDGAISLKEKRQYIDNFYLGERKKTDYLLEYMKKNPIISKEIVMEFLISLERWRDFWIAHMEDNDIWDWSGGSQLLTTGINE